MYKRQGITKSVAYALASFGITVQDRRTLYPFIAVSYTHLGLSFAAGIIVFSIYLTVMELRESAALHD